MLFGDENQAAYKPRVIDRKPRLMTATEAEDLAKSEGLVLVPSNSGPHHPRYLGVSMHTDPATNASAAA